MPALGRARRVLRLGFAADRLYDSRLWTQRLAATPSMQARILAFPGRHCMTPGRGVQTIRERGAPRVVLGQHAPRLPIEQLWQIDCDLPGVGMEEPSAVAAGKCGR